MIYCHTYDEARLEVINIMSRYGCRVKTIVINAQDPNEHYPFTVEYEDFSSEEEIFF
jgi:hypothetical protein